MALVVDVGRVLIAVVGGLVLAASPPGAGRPRRFLALSPPTGTTCTSTTIDRSRSWRGCLGVRPSHGRRPATGQPTCTCTHRIDLTDFYVNELSAGRVAPGREVGRRTDARPVGARRGAGLFTLEQDDGVQLGTVIHIPLYAASQRPSLSPGPGTPSGPTVAVHVVGIEAAELEFPAGQGPEYDIFTTQAFARDREPRTRRWPRCTSFGCGTVRRTFPRFAADVSALHLIYVSNQDTSAAGGRGVDPPPGRRLVGAGRTGRTGGLAVIGQALGRQSVVESEEYPTLVALGLPRRQLVVLGTARNVLVALVGAAGAVAVAFALSPLTPVGEARLAEPSTGLSFDPLILLVGALAIVLVLLALGTWPPCAPHGYTSTTEHPMRTRRRSWPGSPRPARRRAPSSGFATRSNGVAGRRRCRSAPRCSARRWPSWRCARRPCSAPACRTSRPVPRSTAVTTS